MTRTWIVMEDSSGPFSRDNEPEVLAVFEVEDSQAYVDGLRLIPRWMKSADQHDCYTITADGKPF